MEEVWKIMERGLYFLRHGYDIQIHSFLLMSNHFHLVTTCPEGNLSRGMAWLLSYTTKEINRAANRKNQIWGQRFYSTELFNYWHQVNAYKYVYQNPVRAGLVSKVEDYRYSTLHGLLGSQHILIPVKSDDFLFEKIDGTLFWMNTRYRDEDLHELRKSLKKRTFKPSIKSLKSGKARFVKTLI